MDAFEFGPEEIIRIKASGLTVGWGSAILMLGLVGGAWLGLSLLSHDQEPVQGESGGELASVDQPVNAADGLELRAVPDVPIRAEFPTTESSVAVPTRVDSPLAPTAPQEPMVIAFFGMTADGTPLSGVEVSIWTDAKTLGPYEGRTGSDGILELEVDSASAFDPTAIPGNEGADADLLHVRFSFRCPGTAKSADVGVPFLEGDQREVVLQFRQDPAILAPRFVDTSGMPVEGARVELTFRKSWEEDDLRYWTENVALFTDSAGRIRWDDLQPGGTEMYVTKTGYAYGYFAFELEPDFLHEMDFVMYPAVPISGVVRDRRGQPVAGAIVYTDSLRRNPLMWAVSGSDGSYELAQLGAGTFQVWAHGGLDSPEEGELATQVLALSAGPVIWNPVLEASGEVHLHLVDEAGDPLPRLSVVLFAGEAFDPSTWWAAAETDSSGRASLSPVPPGPLILMVVGGDSFTRSLGIPIKVLRGIRPRENPYRLEIPVSDLQLSRIRGQFIESSGRPCTLSKLYMATAKLPQLTDTFVSGEDFELPNIPAGRHDLVIVGGHLGASLIQVEVKSGEDLDLGEIRLPETGVLKFVDRFSGGNGVGLANQSCVCFRRSMAQ